MPIFSHILAISSRMISVATVMPGGGINVPLRLAMAVYVSDEYPRSSSKTPWHTSIIYALLNLFSISLAIPSLTTMLKVSWELSSLEQARYLGINPLGNYTVWYGCLFFGQ